MKDLMVIKKVCSWNIVFIKESRYNKFNKEGDEVTLSALIDIPAVDTSYDVSDVEKCYYRREPFTSLLNNCLSILSDQDLELIADDILKYVFSEKTDLLERYPNAKFVLSEFRVVFTTVVSEYTDKGVVIEGIPLDPQNMKICVREIIDGVTLNLYQQMVCCTAGLDIDLITTLSSTLYEGSSLHEECIAILPSLNWLAQKAVVMFSLEDCVKLEQPQIRALRKQLGICGDGALAVYKDSDAPVYKTGGLISREDAQILPHFQFQKHAEWIFAVAGPKAGESCSRVRYCNGTLMLPILDLRADYEKKLHNIAIKEDDKKRLASIINAVNECRHGAILIIADDDTVKNEVIRLASHNRGTRLATPVPLIQNDGASQILKQFSAVDGAVFLDFNGKCHAFGVILDGEVAHDGNNARGSRYNSTKTYTEWAREKLFPGHIILGVVKSEDGMVDLFDRTKG